MNFSEFLKSDTPVLVDFYAEWCGPCKMMSPILQELKSRLGARVSILKVDVDKNPRAVQVYNVQGVPTLILFHKGEMKWRQSGVVSVRELEDKILEI